MKIVLFQSVDNLGQAGEVVDVKRGYFRNYLGPRGVAREATSANISLMESQRKRLEAMVAQEREAAKVQANDMSGKVLTFDMRSNDMGQLFGSVTPADIAKRLTEEGYHVDRRKIEIGENIRTLGDFPVRVRLYPEVYATMTVHVERYLTLQERQAMEEAEQRAAEASARKAARKARTEEASTADAEGGEGAAEEIPQDADKGTAPVEGGDDGGGNPAKSKKGRREEAKSAQPVEGGDAGTE